MESGVAMVTNIQEMDSPAVVCTFRWEQKKKLKIGKFGRKLKIFGVSGARACYRPGRPFLHLLSYRRRHQAAGPVYLWPCSSVCTRNQRN